MLKYCVKKWAKNKDKLEAALRADKTLSSCEYKYLVEMVTKYILRDDDDEYGTWDETKITEIDNGDYQGTLLYLIPRNIYQPNEYDYLLTYVGYGSCSGCDALQAIQCFTRTWDEERMEYTAAPADNYINEFMSLCKDLICNAVKPYSCGWRNEEEYDTAEYNNKTEG